jgi:hypothetical protein
LEQSRSIEREPALQKNWPGGDDTISAKCCPHLKPLISLIGIAVTEKSVDTDPFHHRGGEDFRMTDFQISKISNRSGGDVSENL